MELVVGWVGCEGELATWRRAGLWVHALDSARIVIGLESFLINLLFAACFADYVLKMLSMKFKDAKKQTQSLPANMNSCRDYL